MEVIKAKALFVIEVGSRRPKRRWCPKHYPSPTHVLYQHDMFQEQGREPKCDCALDSVREWWLVEAFTEQAALAACDAWPKLQPDTKVLAHGKNNNVG